MDEKVVTMSEDSDDASVQSVVMRSSVETLVGSMRILARDIQSEDGVANAAIAEAADRIEQLTEAVKVLHDLLHRSQAVFVPSTDRACTLNYEALVKYEWMTKD